MGDRLAQVTAEVMGALHSSELNCSALHTVYCILTNTALHSSALPCSSLTEHCIVVHCTLYTEYTTLHTVHCTLPSIHSTVFVLAVEH